MRFANALCSFVVALVLALAFAGCARTWSVNRECAMVETKPGYWICKEGD